MTKQCIYFKPYIHCILCDMVFYTNLKRHENSIYIKKNLKRTLKEKQQIQLCLPYKTKKIAILTLETI